MDTTTNNARSSLPAEISVTELKALMNSSLEPGVDFVVVDVRRTDLDEQDSVVHPCAINLPAQSFQQTLNTLYPILSRIPRVIFHCNSSRGRGPRTAGWYQAELDRRGWQTSRSYVLVGGIKAWQEAYPEDVVKVSS